MKRLNIGEPEFAYDSKDPEGFRAGMLRAGPLLDAKQLGASVYELPPGQAICPYHYEYGEEIDAPAGTFLYVPDPATTRGAVARDADTCMLIVGAEPGAVFSPSGWDTEPLPG